MELRKPKQVLRLSPGDAVTKRNLYDLIQYSKVRDSQYWDGEANQIGNTPQQGINWLGPMPICLAVLIKTRQGSYKDDGWQDEARTTYHYSFKAVKGRISYSEKANAVLVNQPRYGYPVLLFTESGRSWLYEGSFEVSELESEFIVLTRGFHEVAPIGEGEEDSVTYSEGDRKYVTHLMAERNAAVVKELKATSDHICDVCEVRLLQRYGVEFIEAHHKTPITTYSSSHAVNLADFVLLCPNCHRAIHRYMKEQGLEYAQIRQILRGKAAQQIAPADRHPATRAAGG